jgi:NADH-quinone oxidoreductase subunit C
MSAEKETPVAAPNPLEESRAALDALFDGSFEKLERSWTVAGGILCLHLAPFCIPPVCRLLKESPETDFDFLNLITGVDRHPAVPRFEVVVHLRSLKRHQHLVIRTLLGEEHPEMPSLSSIWKSAEWHEREAFDLVGITFVGHPDLRRILLPDTWEGHPLRKDFPLEGKGLAAP